MMNSQNNPGTFSLKALKAERDIEARIAAKLATGKFSDTGAQYSPQQAVADHSNAALRMTASIDESGKLNWSK